MADQEYHVGDAKINRGEAKRGPGRGPGRGPAEKPKDLIGTWKKLLKYVSKYLPAIVTAMLCAVGGTIFTIIGPGQLTKLINTVTEGLTGDIDMDTVWKIVITLIIYYGTSIILSLVQSLIMVTVTQYVARSLRDDISHKINRLPMDYFHKTSTGDVLSRVTNDVDTISQSFNQSIASLVSAIALFAGIILMMFLTNVPLALTAILSSVLGFVFSGLVMGRSQKYFSRQQHALGAVNGHVEEMYAGHNVVRAYNGEEEANRVFEELNDNYRLSAFKAQSLSGLMQPVMGFIGNFGYVAVCVVGALLAMNGQITFGVIVAFIVYVRLFSTPLSTMAQGMQSLQSAAAAGERVFAFLEAKEMEDESQKERKLTGDVEGHVEFRNVKFGYDESREIIKDFSADAKPGRKIAIVGPTGAGKTTLVNLLMRFYEIWSGDITIDGVSIRDMSREEIHDQFCMVLQDTWIFEGTVRENLAYSTPNVTDEMLDVACKSVGLYHYIQTLPHGYDTVLNDSVNMSQGQRQQLTIARAMIADRPMLILDEATSSVDTRTELVIQNAMDKLMHGRTSFVIAHRLSTIKNADLILVLKDGDIIESGNHEELLAQKGFYADLYNSQFADEEEEKTA